MAFISIGCNVCGKAVSKGFDAPDDLVITGWIECPECIMKKGPAKQNTVAILSQRMMRPEFYGSSDVHRAKIIEATARDIMQSLDNQRFRNAA